MVATEVKSDEDARIKRFVEWFRKEGGVCNVRVKEENGGCRGVYTMRSHLAGDVPLVRVPNHLILSLNRIGTLNFNSTSTYNDIFAEHRDVFSHVFNSECAPDLQLIFFLLAEKAKEETSFWHPFISSLPEEYFNLATHHNQDDIHDWVQLENDKLL